MEGLWNGGAYIEREIEVVSSEADCKAPPRTSYFHFFHFDELGSDLGL
jgi:hypothetical protein